MAPKNKLKLPGLIFLIILFSLSFVYLLIGYRFSINEGYFDEGLSVYGATRVLNGDIPYKDFWSLYAPGEFYLLAGIFKLFGISIVAERIATVVIEALLALFIYILAKRFIPTKPALAVWLLTLSWLRLKMPYSCSMTTALLFCIAACLAIASFISTKKLSWLAISGIFTGITVLFRQDIGFYLAIAASLIIFISRIKKGIGANAVYYLGIAIIIAPMIFFFLSKSAFSDLVSSTIVFPIKVYPRFRYLPFPGFGTNAIIFYLPILIFVITIICIAFQKKNRTTEQEKRLFALFCLFLGIGFLNYSSVRSDIRHLLPTMIPTIILFGLLVSAATDRLRAKHKGRFMLIVNLTALILLVISATPKAKLLLLHIKQPGLELDLGRARGCYDQTEFTQAQREAIQYIRERTRPDERIFVGNLRHDRIVTNDIMFYFLSERDSATMYHELHPGLATTREIQEKIIDDIKKYNTRYIVRWTDDEKTVEQNESNKPSGITALDNFIQQNFTTVQGFDSYIILYRDKDFS